MPALVQALVLAPVPDLDPAGLARHSLTVGPRRLTGGAVEILLTTMRSSGFVPSAGNSSSGLTRRASFCQAVALGPPRGWRAPPNSPAEMLLETRHQLDERRRRRATPDRADPAKLAPQSHFSVSMQKTPFCVNSVTCASRDLRDYSQSFKTC
jgi:hypothetical protein